LVGRVANEEFVPARGSAANHNRPGNDCKGFNGCYAFSASIVRLGALAVRVRFFLLGLRLVDPPTTFSAEKD